MKKKIFLPLPRLFLIILIFYPFSSFAVERLQGKFTDLINFVAKIVASFGVIMLLLGGFSLVTAEGDPGKLEKGRQNIIWGIIGIGIAFLADAIVSSIPG